MGVPCTVLGNTLQEKMNQVRETPMESNENDQQARKYDMWEEI